MNRNQQTAPADCLSGGSLSQKYFDDSKLIQIKPMHVVSTNKEKVHRTRSKKRVKTNREIESEYRKKAPKLSYSSWLMADSDFPKIKLKKKIQIEEKFKSDSINYLHEQETKQIESNIASSISKTEMEELEHDSQNDIITESDKELLSEPKSMGDTDENCNIIIEEEIHITAAALETDRLTKPESYIIPTSWPHISVSCTEEEEE